MENITLKEKKILSVGRKVFRTSRQRNNFDKQTSVRRTVGYHIPWRSAGDDTCPSFVVTGEDITDRSVPGIVSKKTSLAESTDDWEFNRDMRWSFNDWAIF